MSDTSSSMSSSLAPPSSSAGSQSVPPSGTVLIPSAAASSSQADAAASAIAAESRLISWYDTYHAGGMDDTRIMEAVSSLITHSADLLVAQADTVRSVLSVIRLKVPIGRPFSDKRNTVLSAVIRLQAELRMKSGHIEPVDVTDDENYGDILHDDDEDKEQHESLPSPVSSPRPPRSSARRTSSVPIYRESSQQQSGLSDMELALVQSLSELSIRDKSREAALSAAGRRLLQQLRAQHAGSSSSDIAAGPSGNNTSSSLSARTSAMVPSATSQRILSSIQPIDFNLPAGDNGNRSRARQSRPHRRDSSSSDSDNDSSSSSASSSCDSGDDGGRLPRAIRALLTQWGVPEGLQKESIWYQIRDMVSPTSFHQFWSSRHDIMKAANLHTLYYEGLVLSAILDHSDDLEKWRELASRRWFCLWNVANGQSWGAAQALLPLTMTQGLTARQQHIMNKFQSKSRPAATSSSSNRSSSKHSFGGKSGRGGRRGQHYSGRSNNSNNNNNMNRGTGPAADGNRQSAGSNTSQQ
jgi:hypothetical protein